MGTTREMLLGGGVFVAVLLVLLQGASVGEAMTTDASQTAILNRFNELRAAFGVAAYIWDDTAEGVAQGTVPYGEVIAWNSNSDPTAGAVMAANQWYGEEPNWNCQHATCASGTVCGHYLLLMTDRCTKLGCGNKNSGCSWPATVVCNMVCPGGVSFSDRPFPLSRCPNYPYFSDSVYRLTVTINTTRKAYVRDEFQNSVNTVLGLGDANRVYVNSTAVLSGGLMKVNIYIVTVGSSNGGSAADSLIAKVVAKDAALASAQLYATAAAYTVPGADDSAEGTGERDSSDGADGGAIAAGVLVPLIVIGLVAAAIVVAVIVWKRRGGEVPEFLTRRPALSFSFLTRFSAPSAPVVVSMPHGSSLLYDNNINVRRDTLNELYNPDTQAHM